MDCVVYCGALVLPIQKGFLNHRILKPLESTTTCIYYYVSVEFIKIRGV